jgi:hypothetical protein
MLKPDATDMKCPSCRRLHIFLRCKRCDGISRVHRASAGGVARKGGEWTCELCRRPQQRILRMPRATASDLRSQLEDFGLVRDGPVTRKLGAFTVDGASGYPLGAGARVTLGCSVTGVWILNDLKDPQIEIPYSDLTGAEIGGDGEKTTSAGVFGGGFGVEGAVEGIAIASLLNAATRKTRVDSRMRIGSVHGEVLLRHNIFTPNQLRVTFSPIFTHLQAAERVP